MKFLLPLTIAFCVVIAAPLLAASENVQSVSAAEAVAKVDVAEKVLETAPEYTAHQKVKATTDRVMDIIVQAQDYAEKDPDRFYREVETVLDDVVDFDSFARGVMGKYASSKRYRSLTTKQKSELRAQMKRFSTVFKGGLVQTYAMGLLAFDGNKVEILPVEDTPAKNTTSRKRKAGNKSVTVVQHIYGKAEKPYVVHYKMRRNKAGEWKLRNVTIEAINLGKVYQSQFYSAVKQYNGDIDQVIDNWSVDPTQTQTQAEPQLEAS